MVRWPVSFFAAIWCILIIPIAGLLLSCGSQNHLKLPAGYIDVPPPTQQAVFHGVSHLEGWALSDDGIGKTAPGCSYTLRFMLHGVAQHNLYHAGQMAILKKLVSEHAQ